MFDTGRDGLKFSAGAGMNSVGVANFGITSDLTGVSGETLLNEAILGSWLTLPSVVMPHCKAICVCSLCPFRYCS